MTIGHFHFTKRGTKIRRPLGVSWRVVSFVVLLPLLYQWLCGLSLVLATPVEGRGVGVHQHQPPLLLLHDHPAALPLPPAPRALAPPGGAAIGTLWGMGGALGLTLVPVEDEALQLAEVPVDLHLERSARVPAAVGHQGVVRPHLYLRTAPLLALPHLWQVFTVRVGIGTWTWFEEF